MFHTFFLPRRRSTFAALPDLLPERQSRMMSPTGFSFESARSRKFENLVSGIFSGGVSRP